MNVMKFRKIGSPVSDKNPVICVRFCQGKLAKPISWRAAVIRRMNYKGYVRCGVRA
jgi:hypothetical protein